MSTHHKNASIEAKMVNDLIACIANADTLGNSDEKQETWSMIVHCAQFAIERLSSDDFDVDFDAARVSRLMQDVASMAQQTGQANAHDTLDPLISNATKKASEALDIIQGYVPITERPKG